MSLVKFRNLNPETQKKSSPRANQDQTLSFRKLAARDSHAATDRPLVKAGSNNNGNNRKVFYDKACLYLNEVLNAVKNRKSFALDPGFRILQKIAEIDHPQD